MTNRTRNRLTEAMFSSALPSNPIPFASGLGDLVRENGSDSISSDEAKKILWVLMAQAYGSLSTVSLCDEWSRLNMLNKEEGAQA